MAKREDLDPVDGEEWVCMMHPDLPDSYANATKEAFEVVWSEKGFVLADDSPKPAPKPAAPAGGEK